MLLCSLFTKIELCSFFFSVSYKWKEKHKDQDFCVSCFANS